MEEIYFSYIIVLAVCWYFSGYVLAFIIYDGKKSPKERKEQEEVYKTWTVIRHFVCGLILLLFLKNMFFS